MCNSSDISSVAQEIQLIHTRFTHLHRGQGNAEQKTRLAHNLHAVLSRRSMRSCKLDVAQRATGKIAEDDESLFVLGGTR